MGVAMYIPPQGGSWFPPRPPKLTPVNVSRLHLLRTPSQYSYVISITIKRGLKRHTAFTWQLAINVGVKVLFTVTVHPSV